MLMCQVNRRIAGIVAGVWVVLFIRTVMLFINNYQTQLAEWQEQG